MYVRVYVMPTSAGNTAILYITQAISVDHTIYIIMYVRLKNSYTDVSGKGTIYIHVYTYIQLMHVHVRNFLVFIVKVLCM